MEATLPQPQAATFTLQFDLVHRQTNEPAAAAEEATVVADARGQLTELQSDLEMWLRERYPREELQVIRVDIKQGTILVEILLALGALAGTLSLYGSARAGLDQLIN